MNPGNKGKGRPRGSPNKRSLVGPGVLAACAERLRKLKKLATDDSCDPLENMLIIALDPGTPLEVRCSMWKELAQYCYPKRRAIEVSGSVGSVIPLSTAESIAAIDAALEKRAKRKSKTMTG